MKYFLDFDRTVYDTDAFKRSIARRPTLFVLLAQLKVAIKEFFSSTRSMTRRRHFLRTWGTFLSHGRFTFMPEELREFLYPDVIGFLKTHDCTIVTYGVRAFITAKVTTALSDLPLTDIVYTSRKKGRTIQRLTTDAGDECTFVDDKVFQLVSVAKWCPEVKVIEIRRDHGPGNGSWPVIHIS
jgi:hypothetical protein